MKNEKTLQKLNHYLSPAGNGVFTVYTARETREKLQQHLYERIGKAAEISWASQLKDVFTTQKPIILGVCSDVGGGIMRGANWGPLFIRDTLYQTLSKDDVFDVGDVRVIPHLLLDEYLNEKTILSCRQALYDDESCDLKVSPLSITREVCDMIYEHVTDPFILGLGGDHSCSYPLLKSYLYAKKNTRAAVIHFDAHTDLMKARMGVPICFGSWTYHILNDLAANDLLIQIGIRSSSKGRLHWQTQFGIKQYWAHEVLENSAEAVAEDIIAHLKRRQVEELYITFDIDALDSTVASATGTPESDGLTLAQVLQIIQQLACVFRVTGGDIMEVAPFVRFSPAKDSGEPMKTLKAAATVANCLLNMRIKR